VTACGWPLAPWICSVCEGARARSPWRPRVYQIFGRSMRRGKRTRGRPVALSPARRPGSAAQFFPSPPRFPPAPHFLITVGPMVCLLVPVCYPPIFRTSVRNPPLVLADRDHRTARGAGSSKHRAKLKRGGLVALLCPAVGSPPRTFARRSLLIRSPGRQNHSVRPLLLLPPTNVLILISDNFRYVYHFFCQFFCSPLTFPVDNSYFLWITPYFLWKTPFYLLNTLWIDCG